MPLRGHAVERRDPALQPLVPEPGGQQIGEELRLGERRPSRQPDRMDRHGGQPRIPRARSRPRPDRRDRAPARAAPSRVPAPRATAALAPAVLSVRTRPCTLHQPSPAGDAERPGSRPRARSGARRSWWPASSSGWLRPAVAREVGGRAEHHGAQLAQPPRLQRRIAHLRGCARRGRGARPRGRPRDRTLLSSTSSRGMARHEIADHRHHVRRGEQHRTAHAAAGPRARPAGSPPRAAPPSISGEGRLDPPIEGEPASVGCGGASCAAPARTARLRSSVASDRLIDCSERRRWRAAAVRLPFSTMARNASMSSSRSMRTLPVRGRVYPARRALSRGAAGATSRRAKTEED